MLFCECFGDACPLTSNFLDLRGLGFMRCPQERWKTYFRALFPVLALTLRVRLLLNSTAMQHGLEDFLAPSYIH